MISLDVFSTFFRRCERNPSFGEKFHIITGQSRRVGAEGDMLEQIDALEETRGRHRRRRVGADAWAWTRWWGRVVAQMRWCRRVGGGALEETRCGSDALA